MISRISHKVSRKVTACLLSVATIFSIASAGLADSDTSTFDITARRFEFSPREITVKKGKPVVLRLKSEDRLHGFNVPALNLRADIQPGKVSELKLTPSKAGELDFFCDVFCGAGHEGMNGKITVTE
ncbi:MAG TPA: cupredoxin domain-containing protein [Chroococcales cyanobacterium]